MLIVNTGYTGNNADYGIILLNMDYRVLPEYLETSPEKLLYGIVDWLYDNLML